MRWVAARGVLLVSLVLILAPVLLLFYGSLRSDAPFTPGAHFTLANWATIYGTAEYRAAFFNTLLLSGAVAALSVALGTALALIVGRSNAPGRGVLSGLLIVPLMISSLVTALAWIALAAPNAGFINALARQWLGIRVLFNIYSFSGIVLVLTLHYASFAFVPILAALRSVDESMEEASSTLGGGPFRTAWSVTIPMVWPALSSTFLLVFIFVSENFSVPTLLASSQGFHTLASSIFFLMSNEPATPALAAGAGTMLVWIALAATLWQRRIAQHGKRYATIGGKGGRRRRVAELGRWRWAATGFVVLYLALSVGLPYIALVLASFQKFVTPRLVPGVFTTANYIKLLTVDNFAAIENSVLLAGLGGLVATAAYVGLAYVIKQTRGLLAAVTDYAVVVPTVIPALVLGVGLLWTFVGLPLPIYGTIWILAIAYVVRFVGQGVRQSRVAFVQVSEELVEASRMSGASPARAFRDVVLPLLKGAFFSLWTILFILIFMEISMTILLYSPVSMTMPVLLWLSMASGFQTEAFAIAVVQATIVFVVLYVSRLLFGTLPLAVSSNEG